MKHIDILLAEDNPADVVLTEYAFRASKIMNNMAVAEDGEMALDMLFKNKGFEDAPTPDLVLLDLNIPKIEGREVLRKIKETETLKRIPVVIMSGSSAERDIVESYDLHANCYIIKPVNLDKLAEVTKTIDHFWFSLVSRAPHSATEYHAHDEKAQAQDIK